MVFSRFVEVGRVVFINYGENYGKPAIITDIVDQSRVMLSNPHPKYNVPLQMMALKRVSLTDFKVKIPRTIGEHALKNKLQKWEESGDCKLFAEGGAWEKGSWNKKLVLRAKRSAMTDFDRFKLMVAKKQRRLLVNTEVNKLKKQAK
ncbi:hypothetical protein MP228_000775 [Amoeboaphelidium protococcarum]|nr:hypothetical protein MP228_000775 [Amoeboaphelidium protococcarum]